MHRGLVCDGPLSILGESGGGLWDRSDGDHVDLILVDSGGSVLWMAVVTVSSRGVWLCIYFVGSCIALRNLNEIYPWRLVTDGDRWGIVYGNVYLATTTEQTTMTMELTM